MATRVNRRKNFVSRASDLQRWIIPALLVSLLLHLALTFMVRRFHFALPAPEKIVLQEAPAFHLESVSINPDAAQPEKPPRVATVPQAVKVPEDKPAAGGNMSELVSSPRASQISKQFLNDKPSALETARTSLASSFPAVDKRSDLLEKQLLGEKPNVAPQSDGTEQALRATAVAREGAVSGGKVPGFSNLDDLLAQTGPLQPETAPILMPTDLLFDYDQDILRGVAVGSLQKLGTLMQRNPRASFLIEGHTDSFGSDEYNLILSRRRAESVKTWLVQVLAIDPSRVETRGYGKTRLLVPSNGTIEAQQINRRVEIVIRAPKSN